MKDQKKRHFSRDEVDIFQEVTNIAFGWASAHLAEVIDAYVILSVPEVKLIPVDELPLYLGEQMKKFRTVNVVEQSFLGKFMGYAFLAFSAGTERDLLSMIRQVEESSDDNETLLTLEIETLQEVGNILIGACVGKIAELLNDVVSYSPPRVHLQNDANAIISKHLFLSGTSAILIKTVFAFEEREINGFMFLITNDESISWLKTALNAFVEQYE